jgi:MFS family permease
MAYTSVFPYLPEMIGRFGVEQNEIGKWAGATSSVFSLAQSITAIPWGRAADAYGRKPALILGLISTMITFVIWGMSTSLPMAIIVRAIMGGGNGNGETRDIPITALVLTTKQLGLFEPWWLKWFRRRSCSPEPSP